MYFGVFFTTIINNDAPMQNTPGKHTGKLADFAFGDVYLITACSYNIIISGNIVGIITKITAVLSVCGPC